MCTKSIKYGTGAMTAAKNEVFIGLQHENFYLVRGLTYRGGNLLGEEFFQVGGDEQILD